MRTPDNLDAAVGEALSTAWWMTTYETTRQKDWIDDELKAVVHEAVRLRALHGVDRLASELAPAAARCQSPIELVMLSALYVVGVHEWNLVVLEPASEAVGDRLADSSYVLTIEPQAQLGDFRVDFLLTGATKHYHRSDGGGRGAYWRTTERRMVIECDGFDFHDRTKQQASRDRSRDRALQSLGYVVYRYTGSDIWADVITHAQQAVSNLLEGPPRG